MGIPQETRRAARESVEPDLARRQREVYTFIRQRGRKGATCDEIEEALDLSHQSASARVNELMNKSHITPIGKRPTRSGRQATVWMAAEF